jgi:hypothetical protein
MVVAHDYELGRRPAATTCAAIRLAGRSARREITPSLGAISYLADFMARVVTGTPLAKATARFSLPAVRLTRKV